MQTLRLTGNDRVLIFAPHPDDEILSSGELIQVALGTGAAVRVVFATDGDNNPWPQRWLNRRWHVGAAERAQWGQRRRCEALRGLNLLGVASDATRFLGWPDQGLTECLMRDDTATSCLASEIAAFRPSHVAMPDLRDRHPDHSALRVMLDLALLRTHSTALRLGYTVHGDAVPDAVSLAVSTDPTRQQRKQEAMLAHTSQVALSRRRMLGLTGRREFFSVESPGDAVAVSSDGELCLRVPNHLSRTLTGQHQLLLVLATRQQAIRYRTVLPSVFARKRSPTQLDSGAHSVSVVRHAGALSISLASFAEPPRAAYAKIDRCAPRLLIFDRERWHDAAEMGVSGAAPVGAVTIRCP